MHSYIDEMEARIQDTLALAGKLGATAAKVTFTHASARNVSFDANRLKSCGASERLKYSIMVVKKRRCGAAAGNIPSAMEQALRNAVALADNGADVHFDEFPAPAPEYADFKSFSPEVPEISTEWMIDASRQVVDRLLEADSSLVTDAGFSVAEGEGITMTSGGFCRKERSCDWHYSGGFQKTTGTDMLFSGNGRSGMRLDEFCSCDEVIGEMLFDLRHSQKLARLESGTLPAFIPPEVIEQFLSPIISGINGRSVYKGTSPLRDKLGQRCFSENLSILDNPHIDWLDSSAACDDVGIPTQKRMLVENGVLNLFLYDYDTAGMADAAPTGNSACAPYTPLVMPGKTPSAELLKSIRRGIYVKEMVGFGQTNMANGDFSANLSLGFLIENGEIVGRVKDAMISGNIFELLRGDVQFSSDVHPYYMQPATLLPGISIRA